MTPTQVIASVYQAFKRGDIPYIVSMVAPTAKWRQSEMLPWGGEYTGPEGAAEFFRKLDAEMETIAFQANENIELDDEVFSFGYYEGRSRRTGQTGRTEWMFRWQVQQGKIVRYEAYEDTAALLAAFDHSYRSATMGSTREARRAGT